MENILEEFDSLREILGRKKTIESATERSTLVRRMRNLREMEQTCDLTSRNIIASAVEAMEKAVEAVIGNSKSTEDNEEESENDKVEKETESLPETARPYQPIAFGQKKSLGLNQVLDYFEKEEKSITEMPFKPKAGEVILFRAKSDAHK